MSRTSDKRTVPDQLAEVRVQLEARFEENGKDALLDEVCRLLGTALLDVDKLNARVMQLLTQLYGRKTERINPNQLTLALAALQPEGKPEEKAVPLPLSEGDSRSRGKNKKKRRRRELPEDLPREEIRLRPTAEQLAETSGGMSKVGEQRSEVLEYVPASFKVLVYIREVWSNNTGEIVTAPVPDKVIDKGLPGPGLLTQVVIAKYRDHLPLNRQTKIYARSGVELSRNTLVDWVAAVAYFFEPLAKLIYRHVMQSHVVQADDTKLPVLDRRKAKNIKRGRMWALVGDRDYVSFQYAEDWKGATTAEFLGARVGWLQVDAYAGYEQLFGLGLAVEVGCWMHCRRKFHNAFKGNDLRAAEPLRLIGEMYQVEEQSREADDSHAQRLERRLRDTKPLIDKLGEWIETHTGREPPTSQMGKAFTYATNQWTALCRPLEDGALELDNGGVERVLRGPAMGRRNWLFAGSDEGAKRAAIIATVLESATRHGLDLRRYVHDILVKLSSGWLNSRLDELLPHRWQALHGNGPPSEGSDESV